MTFKQCIFTHVLKKFNSVSEKNFKLNKLTKDHAMVRREQFKTH